MKGLDATELKFSEVCRDNEKLRIDDGFFSKLAVLTQRRIEAMPHIRLGDVASVVRKGIFDINADAYTETGIPFVRITNLKMGLIATDDIAFIPPSIHATEKKTALYRGDIVLSKTAYAAASWVNLPECNTSQDTVAVRLSAAGKKTLRSGAVVAFFNSRHGLALMARQFQGNVQAHLSLPDAKKLPIPIFSAGFQERLEASLIQADALMSQSEKQTTSAEQTLLRALGLENWQPPEPLTYTRSASEITGGQRFDAEFHAPRYAAIKKELGRRFELRTFGDLGAVLKGETVPYSDDGVVPIIRSGDLRDIDNDGRFLKAAPGEPFFALKRGDVLISSIGFGSIGKVQVFDKPEPHGTVGEVTVLRQNELNPYFVAAFLRSPIGQLLIERYITGATGQQHLYAKDVMKIFVPVLDEKAQAEFQRAAQAARVARREAKELLARAQHAVELAIEQDEKTALASLS